MRLGSAQAVGHLLLLAIGVGVVISFRFFNVDERTFFLNPAIQSIRLVGAHEDRILIEFYFRNDSACSVAVTSFDSDCGCFGIDQLPIFIAARSTGTVKVEFDTRDISPNQHREMSLLRTRT